MDTTSTAKQHNTIRRRRGSDDCSPSMMVRIVIALTLVIYAYRSNPSGPRLTCGRACLWRGQITIFPCTLDEKEMLTHCISSVLCSQTSGICLPHRVCPKTHHRAPCMWRAKVKGVANDILSVIIRTDPGCALLRNLAVWCTDLAYMCNATQPGALMIHMETLTDNADLSETSHIRYSATTQTSKLRFQCASEGVWPVAQWCW